MPQSFSGFSQVPPWFISKQTLIVPGQPRAPIRIEELSYIFLKAFTDIGQGL